MLHTAGSRFGLVLLLLAGGTRCTGGEASSTAVAAVTKGYRIESGERFPYAMEIPASWNSLRGDAQEGARVGRPGADFIADIAVARETTRERSLETVRSSVDASFLALGVTPVNSQATAGGGLSGWQWELPGQPADEPRPRREAYRLAVLYDPRGYLWILTFSWSSPAAFEQHLPAFEHALKTFRAR